MLSKELIKKINKVTGLNPVTESQVYPGDEALSHVRSILDELWLRSASNSALHTNADLQSAMIQIHESVNFNEEQVIAFFNELAQETV